MCFRARELAEFLAPEPLRSLRRSARRLSARLKDLGRPSSGARAGPTWSCAFAALLPERLKAPHSKGQPRVLRKPQCSLEPAGVRFLLVETGLRPVEAAACFLLTR